MVGARTFWVRSLSQEDHAVLIAWLHDVLPGQAERAERGVPPRLNDPESQKALDSATGNAVLFWAALRHCGVSWDDAATLSMQASGVEKARLFTVLFHKRMTYKPTGAGEDLGEAWWGPSVAHLAKTQPMDQIAAMTLDQVDMLVSDGLEREQPGRLTLEQVQAMWEERRRASGDAEPATIDGEAD